MSGLLTGMEIDDLVEKTNTAPYADLWNHFVSRWEGIAARCEELGKPFDQGSLAWPGITPMAVEAALIFRLTEREDARQYVLGCINHLLETYGGCPTVEELNAIPRTRAQGGHTTRPKVLSHGEVAMAAEILGDDLPAEVREHVLRLMKITCIPFTNFRNGLAGYASGGNVILCQNISASICALTWGEACGFEGWEQVVDHTCDNVRQYLRNGTDEDGFPYEGAGYGLGVMEFVFLFCHCLRRARWHDDLLKTEPRLRKIPDAYRQLVLPDGRTATMNDSGCGYFSKWWLLLLAREYDRPDYYGEWEYIAGAEHPHVPWGDRWPYRAVLTQTDPRCVEGVDKTLLMTFLLWDAAAPRQAFADSSAPTAACGRGTGTAVFRTSWSRDAIYAALLGAGHSRCCFGHAHAECGHFNIAIGGEYLAVDTGRYNTNEDQHSVVLVDGANRNPSSSVGGGMRDDQTTGRLERFQSHRMVDYCVADASHMKTVRWAIRNFLFIRTGGDDGYVVLLDNISVDNVGRPHAYWWQLQCATTARIDIAGATTATVHGKAARIDCSFFAKEEPSTPENPMTLSLRQDVQEWTWPYGKDQDVETVAIFERMGEGVTSVRRPRLLAVQTAGSCMLLSVLSPRRAGQAARVLRQIPVTNGIGVEVTGDGFTDTILVAPDHKLILTDTVKCFSEFAVIRRDPEGGILDQWSESGEPIQYYPVRATRTTSSHRKQM